MSSMSSLSSSTSSVFESRSKYNRISFHASPRTRLSNRNYPDWIADAFGSTTLTPLYCTFNANFEGQVILSQPAVSENRNENGYIVFWDPPIIILCKSIKSAKRSGDLGIELILNTKQRHLITFKTATECSEFLESILLWHINDRINARALINLLLLLLLEGRLFNWNNLLCHHTASPNFWRHFRKVSERVAIKFGSELAHFASVIEQDSVT